MEKKFLGIPSLQVCNLGLGCMGMSGYYGKTNHRETIHPNQRIPFLFVEGDFLLDSFARVAE